MSDEKIAEAIEKMSFEEALTALDEIVRRLETGKVKLDEAIEFYEKGQLLRKHCERNCPPPVPKSIRLRLL